MELHPDPIRTPPLDSASLVMLRDGPGGLEVLLLRRHDASPVLGGAYVFPGGKVDAEDAQLGPHMDQSATTLHANLAETDSPEPLALACYGAALREAFEESGVLYAHGATPARVAEAQALLRSGSDFATLLCRLDLRLDTQALLPWSRWITPAVAAVSARRFDTRFFVAALPAGQTASADAHEATQALWLRPRTALEHYRDGHIDLAPPQLLGLVHLARHAHVTSVLDEARRRPPPCIRPEPHHDNKGALLLCYPRDPQHSVATAQLPGPTRLRHDGLRFVPEGGYEALWD